MSELEERIRELAYQIWESEGRPHGQAARHWEMACVLVDAETENPVRPAPRARRISKPKAVSLAEASPEPALPPKKPRAPRSATPKPPKA